MTKTTERIDINKIMSMIPHRYPLLLVDRVIDLIPNQSATGIKNVSFNEPHFAGHFPGKPIMPGVLIIEAMAQTSAVLVVESGTNKTENKLIYFMSIEGAKFRKIVEPGDTMYLHVVKEKNRGNVWRFNAIAKVDGEKVAEATFTAMIVDNDNDQ
jgi:3-hydroxyacyl-[acyl-carrier-protein] dehydratase